MRLDPDQLEWIVREVVRRLRSEQPTPAAGSALRHDPPHAPDVHVTLTEKLVTTATLESRLQGVTRVTVPARAIVTPSARDLLKERNIELARM